MFSYFVTSITLLCSKTASTPVGYKQMQIAKLTSQEDYIGQLVFCHHVFLARHIPPRALESTYPSKHASTEQQQDQGHKEVIKTTRPPKDHTDKEAQK